MVLESCLLMRDHFDSCISLTCWRLCRTCLVSFDSLCIATAHCFISLAVFFVFVFLILTFGIAFYICLVNVVFFIAYFNLRRTNFFWNKKKVFSLAFYTEINIWFDLCDQWKWPKDSGFKIRLYFPLSLFHCWTLGYKVLSMAITKISSMDSVRIPFLLFVLPFVSWYYLISYQAVYFWLPVLCGDSSQTGTFDFRNGECWRRRSICT